MAILIEGARVVVDPLKSEYVEEGTVAVKDGEIVEVGPAQELEAAFSDGERLDGSGCLLMPGLIDGHTHLYAALTTGMPGPEKAPRTFPQILERIWWQFDKALNLEDIYVSALVGSVASIRNGITTILDHHASPGTVAGSLDRLAAAVEEVGLRACLAYEVSDRDGEVIRDEGIAENRRFVRAAQSREDNLLKGLFGLHAVFSLSDETLRRCAEEAEDLGVGCHMHLAEHRPEVEKFEKTHDPRISQFLADIGILGPQTLVAHTVHVDKEDITTLRETGTFNVHNPRSNMGNGVGVAPIVDMFDLGQCVGLGSDGFYDIPNEAVLASLLQTLDQRDPSAFSTSQALEMVYGNNCRYAEKVFGCQLGRVVPGYAADLILLEYNPPTPITQSNLQSHVLAALTGGALRSSVINGRVVFKGGKVMGVDEADVMERGRRRAERLWARL